MYKNEIIREFLIRGYIDREQAERVSEQCAEEGDPVRTIIASEYCTAEDALKVMGEYYGLPVSHMDSLVIESAVLEHISRNTALQNKFLPIAMKDGVLTVAICDP